MKNDCSKLIATSYDLCDENQKVLVLNDEKHIVINSKKRVRFFYVIENIQNVHHFHKNSSNQRGPNVHLF